MNEKSKKKERMQKGKENLYLETKNKIFKFNDRKVAKSYAKSF